VVRTPSVGKRSLCATGSPCRGSTASPRASASSAAQARAIARSAVRVTMAFTFGLTRSICERCACMTSTAESSLARM
jgi:hypothetical protein